MKFSDRKTLPFKVKQMEPLYIYIYIYKLRLFIIKCVCVIFSVDAEFKQSLLFILAVLKISVREDNGSDVPLTVRLYGPNTEYVIDRERELQAIGYLSAAGFGAKLHGVFGNGMVQSFINARTLSPSGRH
uniref:ethanolamine kinase n=1 Tax=Nelumbo nucifera TaxID=4432 RepID=A0A822ZND6_NELNU|nr:TPA_asm: hypothetical protein HUJ06_003109 [Nelumbo nucifera]